MRLRTPQPPAASLTVPRRSEREAVGSLSSRVCWRRARGRLRRAGLLVLGPSVAVPSGLQRSGSRGHRALAGTLTCSRVLALHRWEDHPSSRSGLGAEAWLGAHLGRRPPSHARGFSADDELLMGVTLWKGGEGQWVLRDFIVFLRDLKPEFG